MLSQHLFAFEEELKGVQIRMTEIANQRVREIMKEQLPGVLSSKNILFVKKFRLRYAEIMDQETSIIIQEKITELEVEFAASEETERLNRLSATHQREVGGIIVQSGINNGLHAVCDAGNLRLIEFLLSDNYDPNTKFESRFPLNALVNGNLSLECLSCLVEHGADIQLAIRADSKFFRKILSQSEIVSYLLHNGVVPLPDDLNICLEGEYWESAKIILEHGVNVNVRSKKGFRPLDLAILYGAGEDLLEKIFSMTNSPEESGFAAVFAIDSRAFRKLFPSAQEMKLYPSRHFPYFSTSADRLFPTKGGKEKFRDDDENAFDGLSEILTDWSLGRDADGWRKKTIELLEAVFSHSLPNVSQKDGPDGGILAGFVEHMAYSGELEMMELGISYMRGSSGEFNPDLVNSFEAFRMLILHGFSVKGGGSGCISERVRQGFVRDVIHNGGAKTLAWVKMLPDDDRRMLINELLFQSPETALNMIRSNAIEPSLFKDNLHYLIYGSDVDMFPGMRKVHMEFLQEVLPKCSVKISGVYWRIAMRSGDPALISLVTGKMGSWMDPECLEDLSRLCDDYVREAGFDPSVHFFRIFGEKCTAEPRLLVAVQGNRKFWRDMAYAIGDMSLLERIWNVSRGRNQILWEEVASRLLSSPTFIQHWDVFSEEEKTSLANSPIAVYCEIEQQSRSYPQKTEHKRFVAECTKAEYAFIQCLYGHRRSEYKCNWGILSYSIGNEKLLKGHELMGVLKGMYAGYDHTNGLLERFGKYMDIRKPPCFAENLWITLLERKEISEKIPKLMRYRN